MSLAVTVFVNPNETYKMTETIRKLQKYFYLYVDSTCIDPIIIKAKYYSTNHRFFRMEDELMMFEAEIIDMITPHFVIMYGPEEKMDKKRWKLMHAFIKNLLYDLEIDQDKFEAIQDFYVPIQTQVASKQETVASILADEGYSFRYHHLPDTVKVICEIKRNNTDRPYTVIVNDYKENKFKSMFSAFYFDDSWGFGYDNTFLLNLSKELGYEIDLEEEYISRAKRCKFDGENLPEAAPEVYRMTIEDLINKMNEDKDKFNKIRQLIE